MNYRHIYHAGNIGDVLKHATLCYIIEYLKKKPGAFRVIDTHAGLGKYDLSSTEAQKTGEWRDGIGRVLTAQIPSHLTPILAPWLDVVHALNADSKSITQYPGSPELARRLLREQDRLTLTELHPQDFEALAALYAGDIQVKTINLDGFNAIRSFVPPKEKRGLVLVDPAFEERDEYARMATSLYKGWRRWGNGVYMAWYPVKDRALVNLFYKSMEESGIRRILIAELASSKSSKEGAMKASGLMIINPPYLLKETLEQLLPWLSTTLGQGFGASWRVRELVGE